MSAAAAAAPAGAEVKQLPASDTDSGREQTSSSSLSSSSNSSEDISRHNDEVDHFEDAAEDIPPTNCVKNQLLADHDADNSSPSEGSQPPPAGPDEAGDHESLKVRLDETTVILRMALNNEFVRALEICTQRADRDLYAGLAQATLSFLRASLTMEPADIQAALSSINQSFEVSSKMRRKTTLMMRFLYRPNYNNFTDEEIHAELVNAESLLLLALISFLSDQSIICLVRGAFRIRTCYQRYKELLFIMENRTEWSSAEARKHFESGVRMGHGIFNLLMSYLPRRVLRFLEYVGFSGNRTIGVDELDKSVALSDGLRSVFSALVILTYHSYIENLFGLGCYDTEKVEQLNEFLRGHFPNSAFYLLFMGRYHQIQGNLDEAIGTYQRCIEAQNDWKQFHSICHWEIMWCYAVQMDWDKAAYYSDLLRRQSKWSPASYNYQYGTFLYAKLVEDERKGALKRDSMDYVERMAEIRAIMERVPELRIRYAGKTIPAEKFAITRSMKFIEQNNRLSLPALEFLYIWNVFATLKNSPKQVELLLKRIDSEIEHIEAEIGPINIDKAGLNSPVTTESSSDGYESVESEEEQDNNDDDDDPKFKKSANDNNDNNSMDDLCLVLLLKGLCLRHLNRLKEAEESFMKVYDLESCIKSDTFLVPHSAMELALLRLHQHDRDSARHWIKTARNNYTGYLLETIVHFRLHAANRLIRLEQQGQFSDSVSSEELEKPGAVLNNLSQLVLG